jgi:hypothetical protein
MLKHRVIGVFYSLELICVIPVLRSGMKYVALLLFEFDLSGQPGSFSIGGRHLRKRL